MANEIKDLGARTVYDTGAMRDIQEGKGRFDLLPITVLFPVLLDYTHLIYLTFSRNCDGDGMGLVETRANEPSPQRIDSFLTTVRDLIEKSGKTATFPAVLTEVMLHTMRYWEGSSDGEVTPYVLRDLKAAIAKSLMLHHLRSVMLTGAGDTAGEDTRPTGPHTGAPLEGLLELAKHYEAGAKKYSDFNWTKGIPSSSFYNSAMRHLVKVAWGHDDEDHIAALVFNLVGLLYNEMYMDKMVDRVWAGIVHEYAKKELDEEFSNK